MKHGLRAQADFILPEWPKAIGGAQILGQDGVLGEIKRRMVERVLQEELNRRSLRQKFPGPPTTA